MKRTILFILSLSIMIFPRVCSASDCEITYRRVENEEMKIALTFDDGPHPYYTARILDILKKYGVKATFFFVGQNIEYYPEAAELVYLAGHEIGNHTYTHGRVAARDCADVEKELNRCDDAIYQIDEYKTKLFRPPEGIYDSFAEQAVRNMDYSIILWSIDTRDWEHRSPDAILENVKKNVRSGDIILMHDYIGRNSPTPEALEMIIPALIEKGFKFVTVSELMAG